AGAGGAAVGPVDALAVAQRPPEQLVDGDAEGLGLDVPQGQLDPGDGLGGDAARALAGHAVEVPVAHLDGPRVGPHQDRPRVAGGADDAVRVAAVRALAVAGDARIGPHRHELPGPPAGVDDEGLDPGDLHGLHAVDVVLAGLALAVGRVAPPLV